MDLIVGLEVKRENHLPWSYEIGLCSFSVSLSPLPPLLATCYRSKNKQTPAAIGNTVEPQYVRVLSELVQVLCVEQELFHRRVFFPDTGVNVQRGLTHSPPYCPFVHLVRLKKLSGIMRFYYQQRNLFHLHVHTVLGLIHFSKISIENYSRVEAG
jgi:hypothetical protein